MVNLIIIIGWFVSGIICGVISGYFEFKKNRNMTYFDFIAIVFIYGCMGYIFVMLFALLAFHDLINYLKNKYDKPIKNLGPENKLYVSDEEFDKMIIDFYERRLKKS